MNRARFFVFSLSLLMLVSAKAQNNSVADAFDFTTPVFGDLKIAGTACETASGSQDLVIENDRLHIPLNLNLSKSRGVGVSRGTCVFALQAIVPAGMRLIVRDLSQDYQLSLGRAASAKLSLEIFESGTQGEAIVVDESNSNVLTNEISGVIEKDIVYQSECSTDVRSTLLRGNLSALLMGKRAAEAHLQDLSFVAELQSCQVE